MPAKSRHNTRSKTKKLPESRQKSLISSALDGGYWNIVNKKSYLKTTTKNKKAKRLKLLTPKMEQYQRELHQRNTLTNLRKNTSRILLWKLMEEDEPVPEKEFLDDKTKLRVGDQIFDIDWSKYVNESHVELKTDKIFGLDIKFKGLPALTVAQLQEGLPRKRRGRKKPQITTDLLNIMSSSSINTNSDLSSDNGSTLSTLSSSTTDSFMLTTTEEQEQEEDTKSEEITCGLEFCKLGCICTSLNLGHVVQRHCGLAECMMKCICHFGIENYDEAGGNLRFNGGVGTRLRSTSKGKS